MIRRIYVHNYRCLENFELRLQGQTSWLLIGKNGSGKSTVARVLEIFQKIGRGRNRVEELVSRQDFTGGRRDVPMRFELGLDLDGASYDYVLAIEFREGLKEPQVLEESVSINNQVMLTRSDGFVTLFGGIGKMEIEPTVLSLSIWSYSPFKHWLSRMVILRPVPSLISGDSNGESLEPQPDGTNLGAWFAGLIAEKPSAYFAIDKFLKQVMPDLKDVHNKSTGKDSRSLEVQFSNQLGSSIALSFDHLSDGEKCLMISAVLLASNESYGPLFCFWDEPDNFLALSEVSNLVTLIRKSFQSGGQFIATSHNPEAIRAFSEENTLHLSRRGHLEPTIIRPLSELQTHGDVVTALTLGELDL